MIDIKELGPEDRGRWVNYRDGSCRIETDLAFSLKLA